MKRLIVSADDLNLTRGVSEAIFEAHRRGVITSASMMVNLPMQSWILKELDRTSSLGVGIHLNNTFGEPVSSALEVRSLLHPSGRFKKVPEFLDAMPEEGEIYREWDAQIQRFIKLTGLYPTHLDTHHQTHDRPLFFRVYRALSRKYYLPVRRAKWMTQDSIAGVYRTTDFFFGDLNPKDYWKSEKLKNCLDVLPDGLSEIMCHPGFNDSALAGISSFTQARDEEWKLFTSQDIRKIINEAGIELTHFGKAFN